LAQATSEFYAQFDFDIVPGSGWVGFFRGLQRGSNGAKDQTAGKRRLLAGRFTCQIFRLSLAAVVTVPLKCINIKININNNGTQICVRPIKMKLHLGLYICGENMAKNEKEAT